MYVADSQQQHEQNICVPVVAPKAIQEINLLRGCEHAISSM